MGRSHRPINATSEATGAAHSGWLAGIRTRLLGPPPARAPHLTNEAQSAPASPTIYAIGDIHGRLDLLLRLEQLIRDDLAAHQPPSHFTVFLGDYIDRGPDSRGVIDHLCNRRAERDSDVFLRGNHEQVLLDFLEDAEIFESWSRFGGLETLDSYGLRTRLPLTAEGADALRQQFGRTIPAAHLAFLRATQPHFETRDLFFAHAGINPHLSLAQQRPQDLMWIRHEFLNSGKRFEKRVVHGHTPAQEAEVLPNRINVDTGAYMTGRLTCAVLEGANCRLLSTIS